MENNAPKAHLSLRTQPALGAHVIIRTALIVGALAGSVLIVTPAQADSRDLSSFRFQGTVGAVIDSGAADPSLLRHVGTKPPRRYSHEYQWAGPAAEVQPEQGPVTFTGTLDLTGAQPRDFALLGLVDRSQLAAGQTGYQDGAYVYVYVTPTPNNEVWLGLSDGNVGGEVVQVFHRIPLAEFGVRQITFTVDGTRSGSTCGAETGEQATSDGCLTLEVSGSLNSAPLPTLSDSYGTVTGAASDPGTEFGRGAVPGYDGLDGDLTGIQYDLTVSPARVGR